ncbi:hypothetical protein P4361_08035 [Fictibacillus sp. B-59209]|uniref:hypothetical protein n=1 Tax=Fictibacillus sp. B-59209 TaxID=3024873 RepID=UPI002E1A3C31|nr:hypothetical protein [Fictibacillus sp. B-59209]
MDTVLFLPFEASKFFTYKYEKKLILEYPLRTFNKAHVEDFLHSNPTPTLGFAFLRQNKNSIKVPFGEVIIENIIMPEKIIPVWNQVYTHKVRTGKTLAQSYVDIKAALLVDPMIDEAVTLYLNQKNQKDHEIMQFIKFSAGKVDGNSHLLWLVCTVLENYTSGIQASTFHSFLQPHKKFGRSLFSHVPFQQYLLFRVC